MHRPSPVRPDAIAPGGLSLQLLGRPGVDLVGEDGGRRRLLGAGKPFALLTYLAVAPQHEASREFLADLLWGDNVVNDPLHNLRNTLLYLGTNVSPALIESSRSRCRLAHVLPSDLGALNDALQSHRLEDAMDLYAGEFLAGFAAPGCRQFEMWSESVRLRIRTDVANAADVLVRQLMDAAKPRDAVRFARRMFEIEPHEQRSRRTLLEALVAADDRMGALTEAALLEQWLETEEMEAEPSTRAVIALVRRAKPEDRRASPASGTPMMDESLTPDLIGRSAEFAAIVGAWDEARRGATAYLRVVAGAGIGKSRLLADVENRLRAQRAQVIGVRALSDERELSFAFLAALVHALAQIPGAAGVSGATGAVLVGLDPSLASVFSAAPDHATGDPVLRRARALQELLGCVADERSTAVLLDDLHWVDEASLATLRAALSRLTGTRLMIVTASRPGRGDVLPGEQARTLELRPLSGAEVAQLLSSIRPLPDAAWASEFAVRVHVASRGIPLFALLAVRDGCERRLVRVGEREWECDDPDALGAGLLEGGALATAIGGLPPRALRALATMAIAGRAIPVRMLDEPTESAPSLALGDAIAQLERTALAVTQGDSVATAHDLVTETVVAQLPDSMRRTLTERLAYAMLERQEPRWNERGIRLLASVATADNVARRVVPLLERTVLPRGRAVTHTMAAWLGDSPEQRRFVGLVARKLPLRLRLRPFRRHVALLASVVVLLTLGTAWQATRAGALVDATLVGIATSGDSVVQASAVNIIQSDWDLSGQLEARPVPLGGLAAVDGNSALTTHLNQRTGERLTERVFGDSGGSDVEVSDASGATRRLTSWPGDDVPDSWSPDGRYVAFESSRWDPLRHHQLGILDRASGAVRRLTRTEGIDGGASWSPDGSRIAFTRSFLDRRSGQFCVVNVDGSGERCTNRGSMSLILGWRSPVELVAVVGSGVQVAHVDSLWSTEVLTGNVLSPTLSPSGRWLAWISAAVPDAASVAPSKNPGQARRVHWLRGGPAPRLLTWAAPGAPAPYIARIAVRSITDTVIVGVPHSFEISAQWSDSSDTPPPHVTWRLGSPDDGSIDSAGTLVARRTGDIVVVASVGGWRATSTRVVAIASQTRRLATENWTNGLAAWRAFGDPSPLVVLDPRLGAALLNNGDGSYFSGAYSRTTLRWRFGLAVDVMLSTPVTELQWQNLDLTLQASDRDQALSTWDHRTGYIPTIGRTAGATCVFVYPGHEGVGGLATMVPLNAQANAEGQRALQIADGRPYRLRLQVFPDGRCGLAVNGAALFVSKDRFRDNVPLRLVTYGSSWKTRMLLGPLTITEGVPRDIDWSHIVRDIPPQMPPGPLDSTTPRPPK
ncbi:MAG: AAA family ATPase [Gemmatimonadaceae bacterium]